MELAGYSPSYKAEVSGSDQGYKIVSLHIRTYTWLQLSIFSTIGFSLGLDEMIRGLPMRPVTLGNWFNPEEHLIGTVASVLAH